MAKRGGKTSVYLPVDLGEKLEAWETVHGTLSLTDLLCEAIRRKIGQQTEGESLAERVTALESQAKAAERAMRAMRAEIRKLAKGEK